MKNNDLAMGQVSLAKFGSFRNCLYLCLQEVRLAMDKKIIENIKKTLDASLPKQAKTYQYYHINLKL